MDPNLPLVELHRHLDGNVRLATILDIGLQYNLGLPADTIEGLRPSVQVVEPKPSILDFFQKFEWLTKAMVNYDACRRIAYENVEDAFNEGIDYIELRFSPLF
ncbi:MAG: adenosine deaminase, partial [Chloroflexi bacterium]|nr:adenosine deaminase [Chloroflexota bacterium]